MPDVIPFRRAPRDPEDELRELKRWTEPTRTLLNALLHRTKEVQAIISTRRQRARVKRQREARRG
jgi:hypothetical protein